MLAHVAWENGLSQVDIIFTFSDIYTRKGSQDFAEKHSVTTYIYISPYVVVKNAFLSNRNNMFFMGIFHQRHKNWLHMLIAQVLFIRLSLSKVQGILETFFVTYQQ